MLKDIVEARYLGGYRLFLTFEDGIEGEIDVSQLVPFVGVFAPLKDLAEFAKVKVLPELGTIAWPNGADLAPEVLYAIVTKQSLAAAS